MTNKNTDLIGGLIMVITSIFFWLGMGNFTRFGKLFPRAIIIILLLAGTGLLIKSKLKPSYSDLFIEEDMAKMIIVGVISLSWVLLLTKIGFAVMSFFALSSSMWVLQEKRTTKNLVTSCLIAGGEVTLFYYIFAKLLLVPLPSGILF